MTTPRRPRRAWLDTDRTCRRGHHTDTGQDYPVARWAHT